MKNLLLALILIAFSPAATSASAFDHGAFDQILQQYVTDGLVDYRRLKAERAPLDAYVAQLGGADLSAATREEQLAFYINAYNAITLKRIIDHYPVKSIRDIDGVWKKLQDRVAGAELTLDAIEHQILRKLGEPRIHFAIVCASGGCPKLQSFAFTADKLEQQLRLAAKDFVTDPSKNRVDVEKKIIYHSQIFDWFGEDFTNVYDKDTVLMSTYGPKNGSILNLFKLYLPNPMEQAKKTKFKLKSLDYDWELNEQN